MILEFIGFWIIIVLTFVIGFVLGYVKYSTPKEGIEPSGLRGFSKLYYKGKEVVQPEEENDIGYAAEITDEERDRRLHPEKYEYEEAESTKILKEKLFNQND